MDDNIPVEIGKISAIVLDIVPGLCEAVEGIADDEAGCLEEEEYMLADGSEHGSDCLDDPGGIIK